MEYRLRLAEFEDVPALEELIRVSARHLCAPDYTPRQIEAALAGAFGVDTQLIADGTYFVIERAETPVACGGWSRRAKLFGGDAHAGEGSGMLDPQTQPARVRAFFVHPEHARAGLGRRLLERCETDAQACGFRNLELMATLTGAKLYSKCGFVGDTRGNYEIAPGVTIEFIPMHKALEVPTARAL